MPVFHSSDIIPYETMVLDPEGMLPEVAIEDEPGGDGRGGDDGDDPGGGSGGGAGVVGNVESDELEAKTQENPHPHPTRRLERMKWLRETSRQCGTRYGRWSGDTLQEWKIERLVQKMNELFVMMMKEVLGQVRK